MVLGVLVCAQLPASATETWPIKDFRVFMEDPETKKAYPGAVSSSVKSEIERWLKTVAQEYEKMGFNPPHYDHVTDISNNRQAFKVYVYPFSGGGPAGMGKPCVPREQTFAGTEYARNWEYNETYMIVDAGRNIQSGNLTDDAFKDLAHELFHAVQSTYLLFSGNCSAQPGNWIVEGMAEAVGVEMARSLYPKKKLEMCQVGGMRQYYLGLYVKDEKPQTGPPCRTRRDYMTLSFWQFLGEKQTGYDSENPEVFVEPDFRYLHQFFSTNHAMGSSAKEYAWLDKVIGRAKRYGKHQFGTSLQSEYSEFVTRHASYWRPGRTIQYTGGKGGGSLTEEQWMEWMYGACEPGTLNVDSSGGRTTVTLNINSVATRCMKIDFQGIQNPTKITLTFSGEGNNQSIDLETLVVGTVDAQEMKQIQWHPGNSRVNQIGKVSVKASPDRPQFFVVSYVPKNFASREALTTRIRIDVDEGSSSITAKKPSPDPDRTAEEELANALKALDYIGEASQRQKGGCQPKPFEARPCGPVTFMNLRLVTEAEKIVEEIAQPNMSLNRKMNVFNGIMQPGAENVIADMVEGKRETFDQDGASVRITIPQIQVGFSGTLTNAHMDVSKALNADGSSRGKYLAIGPHWVGACRDGFHPSSGKVMIEEFSQQVLRGTFTANLVDSKTRWGNSCKAVPVAKPIRGRFSITNIGWGRQFPPAPMDEKRKEAIIDRTVEDVNSLLPGLITEDLEQAAKDKVKENRQRTREQQPASKSRGGSVKRCDCQCQMEPIYCSANPNSPCCQVCDPIFKLCKGQGLTNQSSLSPAAEAHEVQKMRQQYEAYLDAQGMGKFPDLKNEMMQEFDKIPTMEEKRMFLEVLPK